MLEFEHMIFAFDKSESVKFWLTESIEFRKIVLSLIFEEIFLEDAMMRQR